MLHHYGRRMYCGRVTFWPVNMLAELVAKSPLCTCGSKGRSGETDDETYNIEKRFAPSPELQTFHRPKSFVITVM
jgi:hypothetical protein